MTTLILAVEAVDPRVPPIGNPDADFGMMMTLIGLIVPVLGTLVIVMKLGGLRKEPADTAAHLLAPAVSGLAVTAFLLLERWILDPRTATDHAWNLTRHVPEVWLTALILLPLAVGIAQSVTALVVSARMASRRAEL